VRDESIMALASLCRPEQVNYLLWRGCKLDDLGTSPRNITQHWQDVYYMRGYAMQDHGPSQSCPLVIVSRLDLSWLVQLQNVRLRSVHVQLRPVHGKLFGRSSIS
jgi:hypothetical protein